MSRLPSAGLCTWVAPLRWGWGLPEFGAHHIPQSEIQGMDSDPGKASDLPGLLSSSLRKELRESPPPTSPNPTAYLSLLQGQCI